MPKPAQNPFVAIVTIIGGMIVGVTLLGLVFLEGEMVIATISSVVWALVFLGIFLGYFASRKK